MADKKKRTAAKAKGERNCHPECQGRKYCVPKHAALCKAWHDEKRKARDEKNKKERERRAKKKVAKPAATETQAQA